MLIEFVPNQSYKPLAPAIRVGSVVMTADGYKRFVISMDQSSHRYNVYMHGWHRREFLTPLPERVAGWDENGPIFAPIELPPPQDFSWSDYLPRAGMVVEGLHTHKCHLLLGSPGYWLTFSDDGDACSGSRMLESALREEYRPRPDLMPRFVQQEPPHAKP